MYASSSAVPDQERELSLGEILLKLERSNVEFAIWRKKVDKSLFEHNGTTIPGWACKMWGLHPIYGKVTSRKVPAADVLGVARMRGSFHLSQRFRNTTQNSLCDAVSRRRGRWA